MLKATAHGVLILVLWVVVSTKSVPSEEIDSGTSVKWPLGTYGLPQATSGCPNSHFYWDTGYRFFDTEDSDPNNYWSDQRHLAGRFFENNIELHFCIKKQFKVDSELDFPYGRYCVFQYGNSCPLGLTQGWVKWDDEDSDNANVRYGYTPDGDYNHDTKIYFCCSTSGSPSTPIYLPTDDKFYLLKFGGSECQQVHGMRVSSEFVRWDTEDKNNADDDGGAHPYQGHTDNIYLEFCYYEPY